MRKGKGIGRTDVLQGAVFVDFVLLSLTTVLTIVICA